MHDDPFTQFGLWMEEAASHPEIREPTAMNLATATPEGVPSSRMVLLKDHSPEGFVFYTNLNSRKGGELKANPQAALCFYWGPLERQVRIEGGIEPVRDAEADAYFASRPRASRIGAWASRQSEPLDNKAALVAEIARQTARFGIGDVPRPPHWSGFRLVPRRVEFWQQGEFRIHERRLFTRSEDGCWKTVLLYP